MVKIMLVTANVGSVFENLEKGLSIWVEEFVSTVGNKSPEFVAVHFQETGGKNYVNGSDCVSIFFGQLMKRMGEIGFGRAEGFVDSRSDLEDQFTALSSIYFVHESVQPHALAIWDFQERCFKELPASAKLHVGPELELTGKRQKEKFPKNFYPNGKWSRKGFLRTRWEINGEVVDFVNIHLFHDSDNTIAASSFPSQFAQSREKTLKYTLKRLQADVADPCHMFVFGDFNFRVNTKGVMSVLTKEFGEINNENGPLKLKTKKFECPRQEEKFLSNFDWLKKYDFESKLQGDILQEFELKFHPSYPFEEDEAEPEKFLRTRCPAWCDRILFTPQTQQNIISQESPIEYNLIGSTAYMGDHKPVYLTFTLSPSPVDNKSNDILRHPPSFANKSIANSGGIISSGKSSRKSVESTTSSVGCKQKCSCKCLVSLIKCNLNFNKSNKGQTNKSQSASSSTSSSCNGMVIGGMTATTTTAAAGLLYPEDSSCTLKSSKTSFSTSRQQSTIINKATLQSDSESRFWSILNRTPLLPPSESSTDALKDISSNVDDNNMILNSTSTRNTDIQSKNTKNEGEVEFIEKNNEKNDLISANNLTPIDSLNISDLNVIISSSGGCGEGGSNISSSKSKGLVSSKLPFGWMKRKNSKCRSSVSSSKRLSSIKRNSPYGSNSKKQIGSNVNVGKAAVAASQEKAGGESSSSNKDLCTSCVIL